jgi:hypothetical protein
VRNADYVVHIAQCEFQQFVGENTRGIGEAKKTVVREASAQSHGPPMKNRFMTQTAQRGVSVDDLYPLTYHDLSKYWEEGEDSRHRRLAVYDEEGHIVNFEAVGEIAHSRARVVLVRYDDDFMTAIGQF